MRAVSGSMRSVPALAGTEGIHVAALANAVAVVAAVSFLLCGALAAFAPGLLQAYIGPWVHGLALAQEQPVFQLGEFLVGLVTFTATAWVATGAAAWLYNLWRER